MVQANQACLLVKLFFFPFHWSLKYIPCLWIYFLSFWCMCFKVIISWIIYGCFILLLMVILSLFFFFSPQTLVRALRYVCNEFSWSSSSCCTIKFVIFGFCLNFLSLFSTLYLNQLRAVSLVLLMFHPIKTECAEWT